LGRNLSLYAVLSPNPMSKYTKQQVSYEHPAKGDDHCSDCTHFRGHHSCAIVQGTILPEDWCDKFRSKKESDDARYGY
jgi:hypothetical protein